MRNFSRQFYSTILTVCCLTFSQSCSGVKVIAPKRVEYSTDFMAKIENAKKLFGLGRKAECLKILTELQDKNLPETEKAVKYNLLGVIDFSEQKYEKAIEYFTVAEKSGAADQVLMAQIYLNSSSAHYKNQNFVQAHSQFQNIKENHLTLEDDVKKMYFLGARLSEQRKEMDQYIQFMALFFRFEETLTDLRSKAYFDEFLRYFREIPEERKLLALDKFPYQEALIYQYLSYVVASDLHLLGKRDISQRIIDRALRGDKISPEMKDIFQTISHRLEQYNEMAPLKIGVIFPLSGDKAKFGERSLVGLEYALKKQLKKNIELIVKDSQGNPLTGQQFVRELVTQHKVAFIIGGLFADEAKNQYLEAKKFGTLFVALSQVYLPREFKDHLLIEIAGSIESQVSEVLHPEMKNRFGKRIAMIYPDDEYGKSFLGEFWSQAQQKGFQMTHVTRYDKTTTDFRKQAEEVLGLKFPREREEERLLWQQIYALEEKANIRRVQTLPPVIDFDWLFLPSFPQEALQIIPALGYYDASRLKIFGGPTWRSKSLGLESFKLGKLYFVAPDLNEEDEAIVSDFFQIVKERPKLIELRAADALGIILPYVDESVVKRSDFNQKVIQHLELKGITGSWYLKDRLWQKEMKPFQMVKGKIEKMVF
jgi:23S rRNA pseudoU1915 N3-methylase RlmH